MGLTRSYFVSLLLYVSIVNEVHLPLVTCQNEESSQCIPKRVFLALLRLPEVNSNLAAYSRTARVIQDTKNQDEMTHLKALTEENDDDTEICIPSGVYVELFKDPITRGHLSVNGRMQKPSDLPGRFLDESEEIDTRELQSTSQKRSIAMLAKNDDLPINIHDRLDENQDDENKRTVVSSEQTEQLALTIPRDYLTPSEGSDLDVLTLDLPVGKRNVGTLARDFALPPGRRNLVSLVRDYDGQNRGNSINVRIPFTEKRNVASLARTFTLPQSGKRNIASIARDYGLSYGKRYVGSLARTDSLPLREQSKRNVASLAKNMAWPVSLKRGTIPRSVILRTLSRHNRSVLDQLAAENDLLNLQELANMEQSQRKSYEGNLFEEKKLINSQSNDGLSGKVDTDNKRPKRHIRFSDEYPLPVMQNTNVFDYDEMMEALTGQYLNAEKRFMGRIPQMGPRPTTPSTRRQGR
ncbi:neuropeptide-like precursor 1 [Ptiloglossa arizonensis]|uniref:neuropeptide-like precursor 1 n=1 Tax=Ptiloglossa arizonensis TaxID=3350558 RepID=UPI003FA0FD16